MLHLLLLLAPLPVTTPPPTPAVLAPYIHDGRFDPGDYGWMRGRFAGASAADQAADTAIKAWRLQCRALGLADTRAKLVALGVSPGASLDETPSADPLCGQVSFAPSPIDFQDWDGFARDVAVIRPMAAAYLAAAANAEKVAGPSGGDLRDALLTRQFGEQILRYGITWARGTKPDSPVLTERQHVILASVIGTALVERDHFNTVWLEGVVAKQGWPRRSQVGDRASGAAWLLVQHADADPAFQLRALRLIEPLVKTGEVAARDYAYLYDRVMLKIEGHQRYATQMVCRDGHFVPRPLEDEGAVESRRREAGLDSLADNQKHMLAVYGACGSTPSDTKPASK